MKTINILGRTVPIALVIAMVLMAGIAAAAVLTFYGQIEGTVTAQQAILVDDDEVSQV